MKYQEISPKQAMDLLQDKEPMLLDARDATSYKDGHIEGAMLVHDGLLEQIVRLA